MSYIDEARTLKSQLREYDAKVQENLAGITKGLLDLTVDGNLKSFEFLANNYESEVAPQLIVKIKRSDGRSISLGVSEDISYYKENASFGDIKPEAVEKLIEMNEYLHFVNKFMQGSVPKITRDSKFSVENFKDYNLYSVKPLLPTFLNEHQLLNNVAISEVLTLQKNLPENNANTPSVVRGIKNN